MEEKNIKLEFNLSEDNFRLLENDGYCSIAEVDFLHLGVNRNNCNITKDSVEKSLNSFYNKPLLAILDNSFIPALSTDFKEHARTDEEKNSFIAFGTVPESSTFSFVTRDNGKVYLTAKVVIWKNYFPIIMNILKNRKGYTKVSIELAVIDGEQDTETGIYNIYEFRLLSCVVLGENIMEGIEGSHLDVLRFSCNKEIKDANKYYLNFSLKNNSYKIPTIIKDSISLAISKNLNKKMYTNTEFQFAQNIVKNDNLNKYQLIEFKNYLDKSHSKFMFNLFGGEESKKWLNSILEEREDEILMNSLGNNELQEKLYAELGKYTYHDGEWEGKKYYIEEIYSDEKVAVVRDNETADLYKIPYSIKDGEVIVDLDNKIKVHKGYEDTKDFSIYDSVIFAKKDYGTSETIKINKSKEAMSDSPWGSVNKIELRKKVLDAKNYKALVKDVYMIVEDGWEDATSSKLKYPIMEIKNDEAVYNRYGLSSALAYAKKEGEDEVVRKIENLYKKLELEDNKKGGEKKMAKELDNEEIKNKLDKDNKDVDKIKDDVDSQEDDVKEEKKNSCGDDVIANKIDTDDSAKEGLQDDVDSDKDYWKKQANALEVKCSEIETELKKYKRAEEERKMAEEIDKFAHCMSEDDVKEMKASIEKCSYEEMKNKINEKLADFALKMKESEVKYSVNPLFELDSMKFSKKEVENLEDIINNGKANIGK